MSYATALAALTGITVTGVKRTFTYPPSQVSSTDMPCLFPGIPTGTHTLATLGGSFGLPQYAISLVVLIEPTGQSTAVKRFTLVTSLLDALVTALQGVAIVMEFRVRVDTLVLDTEGGTSYVALVCDVTATG